MKISINHGLSNSQYFMIAQPKLEYKEPRIDRDDKPIVTLTDIKKKTTAQAELVDMWTLDEKNFDAMNGFALLAYGIEASALKKHLVEKYPTLQQKFIVEYWLLKRL